MHPRHFGGAGLPGSQTHHSFSCWLASAQPAPPQLLLDLHWIILQHLRCTAANCCLLLYQEPHPKELMPLLMPVLGWGTAATHGNTRGCAKGTTYQGGLKALFPKIEISCKKPLNWLREKVLSEKGGKKGPCLKHQLKWFISGCLNGWLKVLPVVGMNVMLLNLHSLCSATDVMLNNGIATRGGKKGKEVTIPGLTMCRVNHTNTPFLYENL